MKRKILLNAALLVSTVLMHHEATAQWVETYFGGGVVPTGGPAGNTQVWSSTNQFATLVKIINTSVAPAGNVILELRGTDPNSQQFIDFTDGSTSDLFVGTPNFRNRISSDKTSLRFVTTDNSDTSVTAVTILNENGNVGIGTTTPESRLSVEGAIHSSLVNNNTSGTVLYGGTPEVAVTSFASDGWRIRNDHDFFQNNTPGVPFVCCSDALVFEKTDWNALFPGGGNGSEIGGRNQVSGGPDGGFAFVNSDGNAKVRTSLVIRGNGNVGIGSIYGQDYSVLPPTQPAFPRNVLEINGSPGSLNITGESGLRFRNLDDTWVPNLTVTKVLTVNPTGDVILANVNCCGTSSFIGNCPNLPALTADAGINLNGNDFYFSNLGSVGIGQDCTTPTVAKLDIKSSDRTTGINILTNVPGSLATEIAINATVTGSLNKNIGVNSLASGTTIYNTGLIGKASDASKENIGGQFSGSGPSLVNYGVHTTATGGAINIGIYAKASSIVDGIINNNNLAGQFVGDVVVQGDFFAGSDEKLKQNVEPLQNATDIISQLNPKTYEFNTGEYAFMNLSDRKQYGLIAQEVENIMPELVKKVHHPEQFDAEGKEISPAVDYKALNYNAFIPILIQGAKEQQVQIELRDEKIDDLQSQLQSQQSELDALKSQMQQLSTLINNCCTIGSETQEQGMGSNSGTNNGNPADDFRLEQNVPNPFNQNTYIRYYLPATAKNSNLIVTDLLGKEMSRFPLADTGNGTVLITGNSLPAGTYVYELVSDGKVIASRKMVLTH